MKVPFIDLYAQHREILPEYLRRLNKIFCASNFILGKEVELFEKEFARYSDSRYAVGVNSGTDALFLSLLSLGIGKGDKVIVPAFTFIATAFAVSLTAAEPVFVDIDPLTYNLDIHHLRQRLDKKVKAIIPVHLFGQPAPMQSLLELKARYGFSIVEDCAQAHGAQIQMRGGRWKKVGLTGDTGAFSFYPTKNLGAIGDAGMVITNSRKIYTQIKRLRDCGRTGRYQHSQIGYNSRLDTIQAAFLALKLKRLDRYNYLRRQAAGYYSQLLNGLEGIQLPFEPKFSRSIYHAYSVQFKHRARVLEFFRKYQIGFAIYYPLPLHLQPAYRHLGYKRGNFPVAEGVSKRIVSLPIFPQIKREQIEYVVRVIKKAIN